MSRKRLKTMREEFNMKSEYKPGPGWKQRHPAVWDHSSGIRIHWPDELIRLQNGEILSVSIDRELQKLFILYLKVNGYNKKRAFMAFALFVNTFLPF